jgi:predicted HAD superfamily phosphohydrolase YqeG
MIGDIEADVVAGRRAGTRTILVGSETSLSPPDFRAEDFVEAVSHILGEFRSATDATGSTANISS